MALHCGNGCPQRWVWCYPHPMSVFGGLEDNAPEGSIDPASAWRNDDDIHPETDNDILVPSMASNDFSNPMESPTDSAPPKLYNSASGAASRIKRKRLHITVTHVEPAKTGLVVFFDVTAQLPRFQPSYRSVRRTHAEMRRFADHLSSANPECFVPALPSPQTSHHNFDDMCDKLQANMQKWFDRVTRSPLLVRDDEFLFFVEATTGYVPSVKIKSPATGMARKLVKQLAPPPDECTELREFRPKAKLLYVYAGEEFSAKLDQLSRARRQQAKNLQRLANSVQQLPSTSEGTTKLLGRLHAVEQVSALAELRRAETMETTVGDTFAAVAREAFIVKETLTNRHLLMRDLQKSQASTREKHQRATRLKGAGNISPAKVDDAITQLEAAAHLEKRITTTVHRVSDNLVAEKQLVLARVEADVLGAVATYALESIDSERASLAGWEEGRQDVREADPNGGLSILGRGESQRRKKFSQSIKGDEWSDRSTRAKDTKKQEAKKEDVLDSKQAAQLLAAD